MFDLVCLLAEEHLTSRPQRILVGAFDTDLKGAPDGAGGGGGDAGGGGGDGGVVEVGKRGPRAVYLRLPS